MTMYPERGDAVAELLATLYANRRDLVADLAELHTKEKQPKQETLLTLTITQVCIQAVEAEQGEW